MREGERIFGRLETAPFLLQGAKVLLERNRFLGAQVHKDETVLKDLDVDGEEGVVFLSELRQLIELGRFDKLAGGRCSDIQPYPGGET
jgi:hypothetical protein